MVCDDYAEELNVLEVTTQEMLAVGVNVFGVKHREFRLRFPPYMQDGVARPYIEVYDTKAGFGRYVPIGDVTASDDGKHMVERFNTKKLTETTRRNKLAMAEFHGNGKSDIKEGEGEV